MFIIIHNNNELQWLTLKRELLSYFTCSITQDLNNTDLFSIEISDITHKEIHTLYDTLSQDSYDFKSILLSKKYYDIDTSTWEGFFVDSSVHLSLVNSSNWDSCGFQIVKGEAIEIFRLTKEKNSRTILFGRDLECKQIDNFISDVDSDYLCLIGESGIGKTSLIKYIEQSNKNTHLYQITETDNKQWWTRSPQKNTHTKFDLVSPERVAQKFLGNFILEGQESQILIIDDLHWADEYSLRIISSILEFDHPPFKIIISSRPSAAFTSITDSLNFCTSIELKRLNKADCLRWIESNYPNKISLNQSHEIFNITNGHPLFLKVLAKHIIQYNIFDQNLSAKNKEKLIDIGSDYALSMLAECFILTPPLKKTVRLLSELDNSLDLEIVESIVSNNPSLTITKLISRGVIHETSPSVYDFTHSLIKRAYIKHLPPLTLDSKTLSLANTLYKKSRFAEASKLYKRLGLSNYFSNCCIENIKKSHKLNQLSVVIDFSNQYLENGQNFKIDKKETAKVHWYKGVALGALGKIQEASYSLGLFLDQNDLKPTITNLFRLVIIIAKPAAQRGLTLRKNQITYFHEIQEALRYRIIHSHITGISSRTFHDTIAYYRSDITPIQNAPYKGDAIMLLGDALASNLNRNIGRKIILKHLKHTHSHLKASCPYYILSIVHYKLGTKHWIQSLSLINQHSEIYKENSPLYYGMLKLNEIVALALLGKIETALQLCSVIIPYLKLHHIEWLHQLISGSKAHLLMHQEKYYDALYHLDQISSQWIKELHVTVSTMATVSLLINNRAKSVELIEKSTAILKKTSVNDYSRSCYLADTILTLKILEPNLKDSVYRANLSALRKLIFKGAKFFVCYKPLKFFYELILTNHKLSDQMITNLESHIFYCRKLKLKYYEHYLTLFDNNFTNSSPKPQIGSPTQIKLISLLKKAYA